MNEFSKIKQIYEKLEDEYSKNIFMKRMLFSLSADNRYIEKMVWDCMRWYDKQDIMMLLIDWIGKSNRSIVIFGAGFAGVQIAGILQTMGKSVTCFVDNNKELWGRRRNGLQICSPDILKEMNECLVVIGTNSYISDIRKQLLGIGVTDERIFFPQKQWWIGPYTQYFEPEIMEPHEHESFIDGGSLDGSDSIKFMEWSDGNYDSMHIFEPDIVNLKKISDIVAENKRVSIYGEGLWSSTGELRFQAGKEENCFISEEGNTVIKVTSIDEKLCGSPVSVIKMDIEGSELEALIGAKNTISRYKPRLAICVYHKPEDIIEIPLKILEYNPDYKLYLRHYSYVNTETVLYAI